jgi:flagellar motor switch protein FliM
MKQEITTPKKTEVLPQEKLDGLLTAIDDDTEHDFCHPNTRRIEFVDFNYPDKFVKEQLRYLSAIHENFTHSLSKLFSNILGDISSIHVAKVWSMAYTNFIRSLPSPTSIFSLKMKPLKGIALIEIEPAITGSILKYKRFAIPNNPLSKNEIKILYRFLKRILPFLQKSWKKLVRLHFKIDELNSTPRYFNQVADNESCVVIQFDCQIGDTEGFITFCIPYTTIKPVCNKLYNKDLVHSVTDKGEIVKPLTLDEALDSTYLPVSVELGNTNLSIREIKEMREGTIIALHKPANEGLDVYIKGTKIAKGEACIIDEANFGIRITEIIGQGGDSGSASV